MKQFINEMYSEDQVKMTLSAIAYRQYNRLFKNAMIGIIVLNQENKVYYSNRYAEALFGYSKEELTGKAMALLIHPRYRHQFEDYQHHYYRPRQTPGIGKTVNLRAMRKDGSQFPGVFTLDHYEFEVKDLLIELLPEITIRLKDRRLLL